MIAGFFAKRVSLFSCWMLIGLHRINIPKAAVLVSRLDNARYYFPSCARYPPFL